MNESDGQTSTQLKGSRIEVFWTEMQLLCFEMIWLNFECILFERLKRF